MRRRTMGTLVLCGWLVACGPTNPDIQIDAGGNQNDAGGNQNDAGEVPDAGDNQNDAAPPVDTDGDGVPDPDDPCPLDDQQWTDTDGDGHCDELDDDCPNDANGWDDTNGDGLCNGSDDSDGDGITNGEEVIYGVDCAISSPDATDTDGDSILDNDDPYPRDPFPEFILHRNDTGTIDLMLSNRDGTFQTPVEIGAVHGCTADAPHNCPANTAYRYVGFIITDFDNNGRTDFLAIGDSDLSDSTNPRDLWWFARTGTITSGSPTTFDQRLVDGSLDRGIFGTAADFDNDEDVDLIAMQIIKSGNITEGYLYSYENTGLVDTATCGYTTDPTNPNGCAFIRSLGAILDPIVYDEWNAGKARDSVDVDGDGFRDMVIYTMSSGGDVAAPVYVLSGNGDGTFDVPTAPLFSHNSGSCGGSPANSIVFADFNGDDLGDVIMGFDDDGDAGSGWFYPGILTTGTFGFDFSSCAEAIDLNPSAESGAEHAGVSSTPRAFDFNFDGHMDVMLGWNYGGPWTYPSETVLFLGDGDGTFGPAMTVRDYQNNTYGSAFATPQRLCARFQITAP